jgi:RNA polymerase sigma factor (sigma-70 family)
MAIGQTGKMLHHVRRAVLLHDGAGLTDGQLLESFLALGDETAFEALLRRHGPMVLAVCRRILHNHHDAEDAFQATFLVLAHKAATVVPRAMVANWLYGVARQTALKARAKNSRRRIRESQVDQMPEPAISPGQNSGHELRALLDCELPRLPDKYRVPIVLCDLEGQSHKEAARQLGWPVGTLSGRLSRARAMLAKRLARHGLHLSAGALAVLLTEKAASASVPPALMAKTAKTAILLATSQTAALGLLPTSSAALMRGVLKSMFLQNCTAILTATTLTVAVVGTGLWTAGRVLHAQSAQVEMIRDADTAPGDVPADQREEAPRPKTDKNDPERKLFPKGRQHDFGNLERGTVAEHRFPIVNPHTIPLAIVSIRTSCGCATAKVTKKVLQPGGKGELDIVLDTRRFVGRKTVSFYLEVQRGGDTQVYTFKATVNSQQP